MPDPLAMTNPIFMGLAYLKDLIEGGGPSGPKGSWQARPLNHIGKQVEGNDIVTIRCLTKAHSFVDGLGAMEFDVQGRGDPNGVKGQGKWVSAKDKEGGSWFYLTDGKVDHAAEFIVRRHKGYLDAFQLELRHKWAFMQNHGHWVNAYKYDWQPEDMNEAKYRSLVCHPTSNGYELKFASNNTAVTSSEFLNVKQSGEQIWFMFIHMGRAEGEEGYSPDSGDGIARQGREERELEAKAAEAEAAKKAAEEKEKKEKDELLNILGFLNQPERGF